jgi:hypothetical protein
VIGFTLVAFASCLLAGFLSLFIACSVEKDPGAIFRRLLCTRYATSAENV